jgi:acetyltransferase-like isoleucine patch superfamily enzyme
VNSARPDRVGQAARWGWRWLLAVAVRRTRFSIWRARAWLHQRIILLAYPEIECAPGVTIDPTARVGATDGGSVVIGRGTTITAQVTLMAEGGAIRIGRDCHLGIGSTIYAKVSVEIGDDALIAPYVAIRDHDHATADPSLPYRLQGFVSAPVRLGRNVWLGVKVTVLKGATLGDGAVVGANAVVTGPIEPGIIAVGVPARPLRPVHR